MRRLVYPVVLALAAAGCGGGSTAAPAVDDVVGPSPPIVETAAGDPGPRSVEGVAPTGFARSQAGATSAATTYLSTLHGLVTATESERTDTLAAVSAAGADRVSADALAAFRTLDQAVAEARVSMPTARLYLREIPVAYTLDQFTDDRARIQVWSLGLLIIEGVTQATEVWSTNEVELVWEDDDWRVWSWTRSPGPQPAVGSVTPTAPDDVLDEIESWEGYRYVPVG